MKQKKVLKRKKVDQAVLPGGTTGILQAADVSWNKPFKGKLRELYDSWLETNEHTYTPKGNIRAPTRMQMCDMIVSAWASISEDLIVKSFLITGQLKESKPEDISCMKDGRVLSDALTDTKKIWGKPYDAPLSFHTEEEDWDEMNKNEVIIYDE